jgi:hypothetical protein
MVYKAQAFVTQPYGWHSSAQHCSILMDTALLTFHRLFTATYHRSVFTSIYSEASQSKNPQGYRPSFTVFICMEQSIEQFIEYQAFCHCMIWLLPAPFHPIPSVIWTGNTQKTEKERQFADGEGRRGCKRSQIIRRRQSLVLYQPFNPLWSGHNMYI